eukprot:TRINITY_DN19000_c0_g1_i1.p1 TRINITY_DN19000_c0_g1~~TRINITY_DN19000_c0_g1_i1.p1  ORF type:complete len:1164 (-),score=208.75 TRINITY_DN19000_c0_g1_i1:47-3538(-)
MRARTAVAALVATVVLERPLSVLGQEVRLAGSTAALGAAPASALVAAPGPEPEHRQLLDLSMELAQQARFVEAKAALVAAAQLAAGGPEVKAHGDFLRWRMGLRQLEGTELDDWLGWRREPPEADWAEVPSSSSQAGAALQGMSALNHQSTGAPPVDGSARTPLPATDTGLRFWWLSAASGFVLIVVVSLFYALGDVRQALVRKDAAIEAREREEGFVSSGAPALQPLGASASTADAFPMPDPALFLSDDASSDSPRAARDAISAEGSAGAAATTTTVSRVGQRAANRSREAASGGGGRFSSSSSTESPSPRSPSEDIRRPRRERGHRQCQNQEEEHLARGGAQGGVNVCAGMNTEEGLVAQTGDAAATDDATHLRQSRSASVPHGRSRKELRGGRGDAEVDEGEAVVASGLVGASIGPTVDGNISYDEDGDDEWEDVREAVVTTSARPSPGSGSPDMLQAACASSVANAAVVVARRKDPSSPPASVASRSHSVQMPASGAAEVDNEAVDSLEVQPQTAQLAERTVSFHGLCQEDEVVQETLNVRLGMRDDDVCSEDGEADEEFEEEEEEEAEDEGNLEEDDAKFHTHAAQSLATTHRSDLEMSHSDMKETCETRSSVPLHGGVDLTDIIDEDDWGWGHRVGRSRKEEEELSWEYQRFSEDFAEGWTLKPSAWYDPEERSKLHFDDPERSASKRRDLPSKGNTKGQRAARRLAGPEADNGIGEVGNEATGPPVRDDAHGFIYFSGGPPRPAESEAQERSTRGGATGRTWHAGAQQGGASSSRSDGKRRSAGNEFFVARATRFRPTGCYVRVQGTGPEQFLPVEHMDPRTEAQTSAIRDRVGASAGRLLSVRHLDEGTVTMLTKREALARKDELDARRTRMEEGVKILRDTYDPKKWLSGRVSTVQGNGVYVGVIEGKDAFLPAFELPEHLQGGGGDVEEGDEVSRPRLSQGQTVQVRVVSYSWQNDTFLASMLSYEDSVARRRAARGLPDDKPSSAPPAAAARSRDERKNNGSRGSPSDTYGVDDRGSSERVDNKRQLLREPMPPVRPKTMSKTLERLAAKGFSVLDEEDAQELNSYLRKGSDEKKDSKSSKAAPNKTERQYIVNVVRGMSSKVVGYLSFANKCSEKEMKDGAVKMVLDSGEIKAGHDHKGVTITKNQINVKA